MTLRISADVIQYTQYSNTVNYLDWRSFVDVEAFNSIHSTVTPQYSNTVNYLASWLRISALGCFELVGDFCHIVYDNYILAS